MKYKFLCYHFRPQYYKLIEECVTQIVLHRAGTDPDFRHTKRFDIDVEPLLSECNIKHSSLLHVFLYNEMLQYN